MSRCRFLELDVLPRVGVAGGDRREDILPLRRLDPRSDRVDEGVAEYRHEVIILQDAALDLLGELLTLLAVKRFLVLLELGIEVLDANHVLTLEAAAFEHALVPIGPTAADAG